MMNERQVARITRSQSKLICDWSGREQDILMKKPHMIIRLARAQNDFGFRLLGQLIQEFEGENTFLSPFSVSVALAMTYNGAGGRTRQAISAALGLQDLTLDEFNQGSTALLAALRDLDPQVELAVANSLWLRRGIQLNPEFQQRMTDVYEAGVATLDFKDRDAARVINAWVRDRTAGRIPEIVTQQTIQQAIFLLINAIYFKGLWAKPFDKRQTKEGDFTQRDGRRTRAPMMSQVGRYHYLETGDFQAVSLLYGKGRASLEIFLPKPSVLLVEFLQHLTPTNWHKWLSGMREAEGDVVLPRFKVEFGAELKQALSALGMGQAFQPDANFQAMGAGPLMISQVIHKSFVEVNEEGTEAAAATAVVMVRAAMFDLPRRFRMVVNRPFFCALRDRETEAVLFMGVINSV